MKFAAISVLMMVSSGSALAADAALQGCRAIEDNAERLGCYDALVDGAAKAKNVVPVVATTAVAAANTEAAPAAASKTATTPAPIAVSTSTAKPEMALVVASSEAERKQQATAEFGLEHQDPAKVDEIVSRIPGEFRGWEAKTRITLENGQVWQVSDGTRGAYLLSNPTVTIARGPLGGFVMRIEGVNRAPKVKRLK